MRAFSRKLAAGLLGRLDEADLARADHAEREPRGERAHLLELAGVLAREQQLRHWSGHDTASGWYHSSSGTLVSGE